MEGLTLLVIRSEVQGLPQDGRRCHIFDLDEDV